MRRNETSIVAFVAPWCGHCQRLVPELSKAATALGGASFNPGSDASKPMIPAYAVDCDADENKALCGEMGVQGFPTVKIFPRGKYGGALDYNDERSAAAIAKTVRTKVPGKVDKVHLKHKVEEGGGGGHEGWKKVKGKGKGAGDENTIHAVLLQSPHKNNGKPPLMWKVLATTFGEHNIRFGIDTTTFADNAASASDNARDKEKKVKENWEKDSEVWVYAKGELLGEGRGRAVKWDGKKQI
ncbi:thioredoxin-like protein [Cylindrobasidium torrendii FP15055 ss-10]|uniref:Thioredoxin-like protein n=1 Tax=Cylindrobasidium torrendii FP15055 ss-10 TaxID=1314674 RepID=A0A0D7AT22_9AGAR|nr:thioredoxin-like protein [Cylindrobasidium torrendii FP15055 ss-10]